MQAIPVDVNNRRFVEYKIVRENNRHVWLKVGAAEDWDHFVAYCVGKGWGRD